MGAACGGSGGDSVFIPPNPDDEAGIVTPPPGNFGDKPEASTDDAAVVDAMIDCDATPGACLPPAVCGDKKAGIGESCDDGNIIAGDGCSPTCQIEGPYWRARSAWRASTSVTAPRSPTPVATADA